MNGVGRGERSVSGQPTVEPGWPVSVKGVVGWDGAVVVLRNPRHEWELPGGRLDPDDPDLPAALRREFQEELAIEVTVGPLLDTWIYDLTRRVVIVTYACRADRPRALWHSEEHHDVALMSPERLRRQPIPDGYLRSIDAAAAAGWLQPDSSGPPRRPDPSHSFDQPDHRGAPRS